MLERIQCSPLSVMNSEGTTLDNMLNHRLYNLRSTYAQMGRGYGELCILAYKGGERVKSLKIYAWVLCE